VRKFLANAEGYLAAALLMAVTLLVVAQLVIPYASPDASATLSAVVLALFFWTSMLGIPAATRRGTHLSLVFLRRHVSTAWQRRLGIVALGASLTFFAVLLWTGTWLCIHQAKFHNRFLSTGCPDWVVSIAIPVAAALSFVRTVQAWREARTEG
jgi:C4-dicarboxylate transporter DctQ subunit